LHHPNVVADVGDAVVVAGLCDQHAVPWLQRLERLETIGEEREPPARLAVDHADAEGGERDQRLAIGAQRPLVHDIDGLAGHKRQAPLNGAIRAIIGQTTPPHQADDPE
jgi:hypothetical protein